MRTLNKNAAEAARAVGITDSPPQNCLADYNCNLLFKTGDVSVCTDVTGFGLLGHLKEMTASSQVNAVLWMNEVPVLPGALDLAAANVIPGGIHITLPSQPQLTYLSVGTKSNRVFVSDMVEWEEGTKDTPGSDILCDAQTSGGLLLVVLPSHREALLVKLKELGTPCAAWIGSFTEKGKGTITVRLNRN